MDIRIILVPLRGSPSDRRLLDAAYLLAERFRAHVTAMHIELSDAWVMATLGDGICEWTIRDAFERRNQEEKRARATFDDWLASNRMAEGPPGDDPTASFQVAEGFEVKAFPLHARYADLVVLSSPADLGLHRFDRTLEVSALVGGGCPALIVPAQTPASIGRRVAIAWDVSAEVARAVRCAMPFLKQAQQVHVMISREHGIDEGEALKLVDYLGVHGVAASSMLLRSKQGVGEALLEASVEIECDLMVMGAFHHSHLREAIFGGTTECALHKANLPLLMSH